MADVDMLITMYKNNPDLQGNIKRGDWTHGLCGCFDNLGMCIVAYFVPCVTWGQTAQELGKSCVLYSCLYLVPFLSCHLVAKQRGEIRDIRGIDGSYCGDCLTCGCCTLCALVQEQQEVHEIKNDILAGIAQRQGGTVVYTPGIAGITTQAIVVQANADPNAPPPAYSGYPPQETAFDQKVERK